MNDERFPDRLSLTGMRLEGRHGALEGEQEQPQPFEVDVVLHADLSLAAEGDELSATVDYRAIVELARAVIEGPSVTIIETLAGDLARDILAATPESLVDAVEVSVRKLEASLDVQFESIEASLLRRRGTPGTPLSRREARPE